MTVRSGDREGTYKAQLQLTFAQSGIGGFDGYRSDSGGVPKSAGRASIQ